MKVIALEEHFVTADVLDAWNKLDPALRDIAQSRLRQLGAFARRNSAVSRDPEMQVSPYCRKG
jgi:hypothetical protein